MRFSLCLVLGLALAGDSEPTPQGTIVFRVTEKGAAAPVPCRVHLIDQSGKAHKPEGLPFWRDHFVCPGSAELSVPAGEYRFEVDRGTEYAMRTGRIVVTPAETATIEIELERIADLAADGWWSGDLHVHRSLDDIELLMRAEDLHVAPVITWWNNRNVWQDRPAPESPLVSFDETRYYHVMAGEDEREGGALLYFGLDQPLKISGAAREYPSPMKFLNEAKQRRAWVDIEKPFWWDVPVWLASGQVDSIGLANNHMCRGQMYETEAWGKPRDADRLPAPRGNGFWTQEIYYHVLNSGLRLPPSAGSASGVLPNPVGYNRVYVHVDGELTYEKWWQSLRAGRSFVTNGPLLRVRAGGKLPGHVFTENAKFDLEIDAALTSRDPVRSFEVIKNGRVERSVPYDEWQRTGTLGRIAFDESGWMLVRVVADVPHTFRFASTAPWYVEIGDSKRRVSRSSAQFFLDWVNERIERVKVDDDEQRAAVLSHHRDAQKFWRERAARANAD